jgi:O-antigen ligase
VYNNPNALGLYLGPLVVVGLGLLIEIFKNKKNTPKRNFLILFLITSLILFLASIYLSKSRGASVGIIVSLIFFGMLVGYGQLSKILQKIGKTIFYVLVVAFIATSLLGFVNIDKFVPKEQIRFTDSVTSRLCIWQGTKHVLEDSPILGLGLSGFPQVYPKFATCEQYPFQYPHNIFLNFWTEVGLIGLMVFLYIVYRYWRVLTKHLGNFVAVGLISVIIYSFTHGLVDAPYFKNDLSSQFWVFLAVAAWFEQSERKK